MMISDSRCKLSITSEYTCSWKDRTIDVTLSVRDFKRSIGFYNVLDPSICKICGNPKILKLGTDREICLESKLHSRLKYVDGVFQLGYYYNKNSFNRKDPKDLLNDHILKLKTRAEFAKPLAQAILLVVERHFPSLFEATTIVPVPNFKDDPIQDSNGVALAFELEKLLKKKGIEINAKKFLVKLKNEKVHYMDIKGREKAVVDMFSFDNSISIQQDRIILLDDVLLLETLKVSVHEY